MTSNNPFSLEGKKVLVVGASSGIGRAIAKKCADMGADLIVASRNTEALQSLVDECTDGNHNVITADITTDEGIKNILDGVDHIDGLVLVSGKANTLPVTFSSRKHFDDIFNLNFFPLAEITRMLMKKRKLNNGGSIVFIASIGGVTSIGTGKAVYGTSKAALNTFMKFCAYEFATKQIRANSIAPGMVHTKIMELDSAVSKEDYQKDVENYPLKRYGQPDDIANGAIYLLSDASSWVTGHTLVIDGGLTMY